MALAGAANAMVFTAVPQPSGTQLSLQQAIAMANSNPGNNIIVLTPVTGSVPYLPTTALTIASGDNLTITGSHAVQDAGGGTFQINGQNQPSSPAADFITVNSGASLTLEGVGFGQCGQTSGVQSCVSVKGTLTVLNSFFGGGNGTSISVGASPASAFIEGSTLDSNGQGNGVSTNGPVTLINDTIANMPGHAIFATAGGTFQAFNTLMYRSLGGGNCVGVTTDPSPSTDGSLSDDATCGVQYINDTSPESQQDSNFISPPAEADNGGPTFTDAAVDGSNNIITMADHPGNPSFCPVTDGRFFINPPGACDIGALTAAATQETAAGAPTCGTPTVANNGGVLSQTVPVTSGASGFGPEGSGPGDIVNGADAINGVINNNNSLGHSNAPGGITNGTVALLNPLTRPGNPSGGLSAVATKTATGPTFWSFTSTDWAGLSTYCS